MNNDINSSYCYIILEWSRECAHKNKIILCESAEIPSSESKANIGALTVFAPFFQHPQPFINKIRG